MTAVGEVAEQNLRELGHITLRFDGHREAEFPYRPCGGPGAGRHRARLRTEVCCLKEREMNQVAVVIGGGQTLGEFLCRGLAAEGYRVAVVDIQSEKPAASPGD